MYGKTSSSFSFLTRSASHSTKGSRRGFCSVGVPTEKKRHASLGQRLGELHTKQREICSTRKASLSNKERARLYLEEQNIVAEIRRVNFEIKAEKLGQSIGKSLMVVAGDMVTKGGEDGRG